MTTTRFTKEQLLKRLEEQMSSGRYALGFVQDSEILRDIEMDLRLAEIALASLTAEPVAIVEPSDYVTAAQLVGEEPRSKAVRPLFEGALSIGQKLYTTPPAPAVDADDNFYSWFGREWHEHYQHNQYTTAAKQMLGVMAESAWRAGRRAAMLQGSQPVSNRDELPEEKGASLQLRNLIRQRHAEWSDKTFGNVGPVGPLKHLSKEAQEAAVEPDDLSEWADMQFLLWDAQRRAGISDGEITAAM